MKLPPAVLVVALAALVLVSSDFADARRMGGGRSFGAQRESVTPARPTPAPSTPAGNAASQPASPAAAAPQAPAPAPSAASRWLGPIAGIAAGLGLAALLSHFGLSEGFASLLLVGLLVAGGIFLLRMFLGRRLAAAANPYAGAPGHASAAELAAGAQQRTEPAVPPEPGAPAFGVNRKPLPPGFDAVGFAREAKKQYIEIQRSYDNADRASLASVMTSEMNSEIGRELDERGSHHPTEIVTLDADVLDVATEGDKYWVSVRFTGLLREDGEPQAKSVDEVWNLTKPVKGGSGWLLAGISQLA